MKETKYDTPNDGPDIQSWSRGHWRSLVTPASLARPNRGPRPAPRPAAVSVISHFDCPCYRYIFQVSPPVPTLR
eukprot:scaffold105774_cov62-Cyclotella_meneghiniana.AAC.1